MRPILQPNSLPVFFIGSMKGDPEVDLVGPEMDWMAHQWRSAMLASDGCIYAVPCNASRCRGRENMGKSDEGSIGNGSTSWRSLQIRLQTPLSFGNRSCNVPSLHLRSGHKEKNTSTKTMKHLAEKHPCKDLWRFLKILPVYIYIYD